MAKHKQTWGEWGKEWKSWGAAKLPALPAMFHRAVTAPTPAALEAVVTATVVAVGSDVSEKSVDVSAFAGVTAAAGELAKNAKATVDATYEAGLKAAISAVGAGKTANAMLQDPKAKEHIKSVTAKAWEAINKRGVAASKALSDMCNSIAKWFKETAIGKAISDFFAKLEKAVKKHKIEKMLVKRIKKDKATAATRRATGKTLAKAVDGMRKRDAAVTVKHNATGKTLAKVVAGMGKVETLKLSRELESVRQELAKVKEATTRGRGVPARSGASKKRERS